MTRAEKVIAFIEAFCRIPEGVHVGKALKLEPFQKQFIIDVYDNPVGTEKAILSIGRKNGKTGLIACLLLTHLVGPEAKLNSQIVSGAMSREQAALVFNLAVKMINLNPDLQDIIHIIPSGKRLHGLPMNTEYKALAAEGKTAQGLSPVLAILDEVGQVQGAQNDFVDAIVTAQGAHEHPLLIAISTQAANDADLLSVWIDDAERSQDPHIVSHVYAAPQDADVLDRDGWKAANPALGKFRSLRDLEKLAENAARMPSAENTFRNLNLNQRVSTNNPFISAAVWADNSAMPSSLQDMEVYAGLDLSARTDLTALVLIGRDLAGIWHVEPHFWTPKEGITDRSKRDRAAYDVWAREGYIHTTPSATVDYAHVVADMADILADLNVCGIAYDRWRMDIFKGELDRAGLSLPMIEYGQGFKDMSPAIDALEAALLNKQIRHGNHPVLTMCAANAVLQRDPAGNRKLDKFKASGRIDGIVALAMAFGASQKLSEPVITSEQMDDFFNNMVIV
ncbi:terminase large subunit [Suttonella ornithocola]|uniref:Phage terminase-like protein, large subunit n=1 Tax=Suttonella ornithocola TaxID=279832 RepID=A0A380MV34_9GAMM|nr:terminase TerL endonuclease subunit [Suttonella ornithocola]SUO95247.1 Phage terminase-like protein, large subunit [Suttonella ornithocola]